MLFICKNLSFITGFIIGKELMNVEKYCVIYTIKWIHVFKCENG